MWHTGTAASQYWPAVNVMHMQQPMMLQYRTASEPALSYLPHKLTAHAAAVAVALQAYGDESFVLLALLRFGGEPFVNESTGALLYRFPALQTTGVITKV